MRISLYVHFPFCISKCSYCGFYSVSPATLANNESIRLKNIEFAGKKIFTDKTEKIATGGSGLPSGKIPGHIEALYYNSFIKELSFFVSRYNITEWDTIYFGGGSPSLMSLWLLRGLMEAVRNVTGQKSFSEVTIEANPSEVTPEWVEGVKESGITRISLGIQSMNDGVLKKNFRRADSAMNLRALSLLASSGLRWSCDIIAGLPGETGDSFAASLKKILEFSPPHISLYSLSIDEGSVLAETCSVKEQDVLLDSAEELWGLGMNTLLENGYERYEISNYAKSGEESRHNLNYWRMNSWLGIGPGASGTILGIGSGRRFYTGENVPAWLLNPLHEIQIEELDKKTCIKEFLMMGLRLREGVDSVEFLRRFDFLPDKVFDSVSKDYYTFVDAPDNTSHKGENFTLPEKNIALSPKGFENYNQVIAEVFQIVDDLE